MKTWTKHLTKQLGAAGLGAILLAACQAEDQPPSDPQRQALLVGTWRQTSVSPDCPATNEREVAFDADGKHRIRTKLTVYPYNHILNRWRPAGDSLPPDSLDLGQELTGTYQVRDGVIRMDNRQKVKLVGRGPTGAVQFRDSLVPYHPAHWTIRHLDAGSLRVEVQNQNNGWALDCREFTFERVQ